MRARTRAPRPRRPLPRRAPSRAIRRLRVTRPPRAILPSLVIRRLRVILRAPAYTAGGQATYRPADKANLVDVDDYRTLRQVAWAGSFEGQSTVGVGVRARLPFRVLVLDGPGDGARLVIDVAHGW